MATYIVLIDFTDQGIRNLKDSRNREAAFEEEAAAAGAKVKDVYWTVGSHDGLLILECDEDTTAAALMLSLASHGSVRTQLLRAFDRAEIGTLLEKLG